MRNGAASMIKVWMDNEPYGGYTKTFVGASGWREGLPIVTEDWANGTSGAERKRWSWTEYTQDDISKSYILNPRSIQSKVGDNVSIKRTTVDYLMQSGSLSVSQYGLVSKVKVFDANQSTILKTQTTEYNLDSNYTSRRIIGLPSESKLYDGTDDSGTLVSKASFEYDENGYAGTGQTVTATQHDSANFGTNFLYRGNQTRTKRWDVTNSSNGSMAVSSQVKYNITGSPISQTDPRGRVTTVSYTDDWNDSVSRSATHAYPTTITDAGGNFSTVEYRYDIGANVWARSPVPTGSGNLNGKTSSRIYDDTIGRIVKEKIENSGAYTRYDYASNGISLDTYTTIVDANNDSQINGSDEVRTETLFDGAGRIRLTRTADPQTNNFIGKRVEYDILGQVKRETVPTEINSSWNPAGDDYRGMDGNNYIWLWNSREYDWKGRVTREINSDATDRLYAYEGCGCAGNQVTTIKGEITEAIDISGTKQTTKRRTQKIYQDILGRTFKTEVWDLDGGGSAPYSTVKNTFNGRDQVTQIRQYSGAETSSTYQDTTMSYDGHGRLASRHRPEEFDASNNNAPTYTTYTYNADDSVATMTDPRGAVTTYKYGNIDDSGSSETRGLLTKIQFSSPNTTNIPDPADIIFNYDAAGNRTNMTDGSGTMSYVYDELSRLKEETKNFADTLSEAPTGGYKLKYNYFLTGGLKSIEDPAVGSFPATTVTYTLDKIGRTTAIGGSGFYDDFEERSVNTFASSINYRAFGAVKSMSYGTTQATNVNLTFDTRLRPSTYLADSNANNDEIQNKTYTYNNDGTVKQAVNNVEANFSQYNDYDFAGRIKKNDFGTTSTGQPYKQTLGYDAFNNITSRNTKAYNFDERNFTATFTNNRKSSGGYQSSVDTFDVAGNITQNQIFSGTSTDIRKWKFDASGRMSDWEETLPENGVYLRDTGAELVSDGDGRIAKRANRVRVRVLGSESFVVEPEYTLFSSVTGQKITTLNQTGGKYQTFVYMGSSVIAQQTWGGNDNDQVVFKQTDPITASEMQTSTTGEISPYGQGRNDIGAMGEAVPSQEPEEFPAPNYKQGGGIGNPETQCQVNGHPMSCNRMKNLASAWGALFAGSQLMDVSVWKYNKYLVINNEDKRLSRENYKDELFWALLENLGNGNYGKLVDSWYETRINLIDLPVSIRGDKKFEEKTNKAKKRLSRKSCKKLLAKLKDYASISEIENAIDTHPAFSVKNSNVKVRNSGIFTQEEIKNIDGLPNTYPNNLAKDDLEKTIPDYFLSAGANAITNKDPNIPGVYYDDVNNEYDSQTILHESIHFATGLNDVDLANALGLKNSEGKTFEKDDYRNASRAIKEAIYANCPSSFF